VESRRPPVLAAFPLARALGQLYATGGTVALVWTVLPHEPARGDRVVAAMAVLALLLGGSLVATARRLPTGLLHTALLAIQLVIGVAYLAGGQPGGDIRLFFLWATPYAALCFRGRAAVAHMTWTSGVLITALALMPRATHAEGYGVALMLVGTLMATGVLAATAAHVMRTAEAVQRHEATHDALTGLGNRRRLLDVLQTPPSPGAGRALVLLDLDGFKGVNDRHGHGEGDALLREVAAALGRVVRDDDVVCRLGGDEFALVLSGLVSDDDALTVVGRALEGVAACSPPGLPGVAVGASAGVRVLDGSTTDSSSVLRDADVALYASKQEGRTRPHLWSAGLRAERAEQLALADDLREALREGQLSLVYQPVVDVATMRVRGVEALARWHHPVRGVVPPDRFVPCAEQAGLAAELTRWVLRSACAHAAAWPVADDGVRVNLAVNVSAVQLADLDLVTDVQDALALAGLDAGDVVLEVTETAAVTDLDAARHVLDALAGLGVGLALDDFCTGYSSLSHVQALPFHILKVDRSFVSACAQGDRRATATVAAVGELARRLEVDVVAEGVEDLAQLDELRALGCGFAQGFGLSRPLAPEVIAAAMALQGPQGWVIAPAALTLAAR
jgi:diguanylate cyclase (GGDEF)-like protein